VIPQNVDWNNPYQSLGGETVYRYKFTNGVFKLYASFDSERFDLNQKNINFENPIRTDMNNNNFYLNSSYKGSFGTGWQLTSGVSYGYSKNKLKYDITGIDTQENAAQLKLKLSKKFSNYFKLSFGC
jgi:hypothetical protein